MPPEGPPKEPNIDEELLQKLIPRVKDEMLKGTPLDSAIHKVVNQISPSVARNMSHEDFSGYYNIIQNELSGDEEKTFSQRANDPQLLKEMEDVAKQRRDDLLED